jgi:phthiodiolone/phenolphthiodiolone dimycocerosates ketoreductase
MPPPVKFGVVMPPIFPPRMQVMLAQAFEWMGFDQIWFPDHISFPDFMPAPDPWSIITACAVKTKRIRFGTAVSDPHRHHPAAFAQRLATIDQLSKGRIILGLGSGEVMNLDPFGIPWNRRLGRLKEAVTVIRGLLDSDEPFDFQGEFFQIRQARLSVRPYKRRKLPIYLAALGPKAQQFAGQVADGWVPTAMPPELYGEYFAPIAASARAAGRNPDQIERCVMMTVSLGNRPRPVLELMQDHSLGLIWPPIAEKMGLKLDFPAEAGDISYPTVNPHDPESSRRFHLAQSSLPHDLISRFVFIGDVARVRRAIGDYIDAGGNVFHLTNASLDPTAILKIATEIVPYFKKRPAPVTVQVVAAGAKLARSAGLVKDADPKKAMEWLKKQQ